MALNSGNTAATGLSRHEPVLASIMGDQNYAMCIANHQMQQNDLSTVTFEWTNRSSSTSSMSFPRFGKSLN
jgi:hypothetical protein